MATGSVKVDPAELTSIVEAIARLGPQEKWKVPAGYPDSLALCLLDSIWSLGSNYDRHVIPVLNRYRAFRRGEGAEASQDTSADLAACIQRLGGPDALAVTLGNRQRTSTRSGVLKADAVAQAAELLASKGILTPADLRLRAEDIAGEWRRLPGQKSSSTGWRYLLMLAGTSQAKSDRMICRWVGRAVGDRRVTPDDAHGLLVAAALKNNLDLRALDHRIWLEESGRQPST